MTTRHNHHGKSRPTTTGNLFALANLLFSFANIGANIIGNQHRAQVDALKAENLRLKNQIEAQRVGQAHNNVLLGDLNVELRLLQIEDKKRKLGITKAPFSAIDYDDPPSRYDLDKE